MAFAPLARRLRRAALLWCSAAGATAGAGLFAASRTVAFTMLGAVVLGFAGTTVLTCTQAILSDRHGERRDRALTEANVGAAACAVLAPLLLGLFQSTPAGWRAAMALPALALAGLYLRYRHQPLPAAPGARPAGGRVRLPLSCWLLATLVAVGIAVEFCLIYFGAELLTATGLRTAQAAAAMSGFYLGILVGRLGGAWLTRRAGRTVPLLYASLAITAAGFLAFWLAGTPVLAIAGLFVCGLGIANLYPLSLALTLAAAPGNGDTASARTQLLGGVLVIAAPYLLGSLADHLGLRTAFTIEPVLIGARAPAPGRSPARAACGSASSASSASSTVGVSRSGLPGDAVGVALGELQHVEDDDDRDGQAEEQFGQAAGGVPVDGRGRDPGQAHGHDGQAPGDAEHAVDLLEGR